MHSLCSKGCVTCKPGLWANFCKKSSFTTVKSQSFQNTSKLFEYIWKTPLFADLALIWKEDQTEANVIQYSCVNNMQTWETEGKDCLMSSSMALAIRRQLEYLATISSTYGFHQFFLFYGLIIKLHDHFLWQACTLGPCSSMDWISFKNSSISVKTLDSRGILELMKEQALLVVLARQQTPHGANVH